VTIARGRLLNTQGVFQGFHGAPWDWKEEDFTAGGRVENDEQVPAGVVTEIEVRNVAGSIDIRGEPGASAVAVHSVKTAAFKRGMDGVRVEIHREGGRLFVEEKHDSGFLRNAGTVSFQITVPRGMKVIDAHSVSGGITVRGTEAGIDQNLSTISGGVSTDRAGDLDASSTSGSIHFTSRGSSLNVRTVSGSIDGSIEALGPEGSAHFSTVSGSITVNAFAGLDAAVSLHSLSGRVSCDFPVSISEQKNNRLSGTIGKGSASLDAGTVSGSITISKL
jgi:DUF4097 and DUF4098 domain-containing protein YvlB